MIKINFFKLTIYSLIIFLMTMISYKVFSYFIINSHDSLIDISSYATSNFYNILKYEGVVKQLVLVVVMLFFGLAIASNILKLTKINALFKVLFFIITLIIHSSLITLSIITTFKGNLLLYEIISILMLLMIIIFITTILIDYIKTRNDYKSIFIRMTIAIISITLVITNAYKITNDYKVNTSLINNYNYKIEQIKIHLNDENHDWIESQINFYENQKLTLYTNGLLTGKSELFFYGTLKVDLFTFGTKRLILLQTYTNQIEDLINNTFDHEVKFSAYEINCGLYIENYTVDILLVLLITIATICMKKYPLSRVEESEKSIYILLLEHYEKGLITIEEYNILTEELEVIYGK